MYIYVHTYIHSCTHTHIYMFISQNCTVFFHYLKSSRSSPLKNTKKRLSHSKIQEMDFKVRNKYLDMYMSMFIFVFTYVYMYICMHKCEYLYLFIYIYICICIYIDVLIRHGRKCRGGRGRADDYK
jgi:L-asparagine transporter-like permease